MISFDTNSAGDIDVSDVDVRSNTGNASKNSVSMVSVRFFQTVEKITIQSSHIQGILIKSLGASNICQRWIHNITISKSTAYSGIQIKCDNRYLPNIVITSSNFDRFILSLEYSKPIINHLEIKNTSADNGVIIKYPTTRFNKICSFPDDLSKRLIQNISFTNKKNNIQQFINSFDVHKSDTKRMLVTKDRYTRTTILNVQALHFSESKCDICIDIDGYSVNISTGYIKSINTTKNIVEFRNGKFLLSNAIIQHEESCNLPLIELKQTMKVKMVNVTVEAKSQENIMVILKQERMEEYHMLKDVKITCSVSADVTTSIPHILER